MGIRPVPGLMKELNWWACDSSVVQGGGRVHLRQPALIVSRARSLQCSLQLLWQSDEGNRNRSLHGQHGGKTDEELKAEGN